LEEKGGEVRGTQKKRQGERERKRPEEERNILPWS
jgi:hypothetical protein